MRRWGAQAALLILIGGVAFYLSRRPAAAPATYWAVPDFALTGVTSDSAFPFGRRDLLGHVWIADFIFTNCAGPCPLMTAAMADLQKTLPPWIRFLSFSIDPQNDTVPALQAYAKRFGADPNRWVFVRGKSEAMHALAVDGFKLGVTRNPEAPAGLRYTHSTKFVLIDASGTLRGFYESQDAASLGALRKTAENL